MEVPKVIAGVLPSTGKKNLSADDHQACLLQILSKEDLTWNPDDGLVKLLLSGLLFFGGHQNTGKVFQFLYGNRRKLRHRISGCQLNIHLVGV